MVTFNVEGLSPLVDDPFHVSIDGVPPGELVTVEASHVDARGNEWRGEATYRAGDDGTVDLSAAPHKAPWNGPDPRGLLWSMRVDDVEEQPRYGDELSGELTFTVDLKASWGGAERAATTVVRRYHSPGVTVEEWRDGPVANLFLPAGGEPTDVVVVLNGTWGGFCWSNEVAALLASRGRAALALAYFDWYGHHGLPNSIRDLPLEYVGGAFERLAAHPAVRTDNLAVVGISKGSELALLVAATYPQVRELVAYVPGSYVWQGISWDAAAEPTSCWSLGGKPMPFAPLVADEEFYRTLDKRRLGMFHEHTLRDRAAIEDARIPVDRIEANTLLLSVSDDYAWPSRAMSEEIVDAMTAAGKGHLVRHIAYDGSGHPLFVPGVPANGIDSEPEPAARLDFDAWAATLRHLGLEPPRS